MTKKMKRVDLDSSPYGVFVDSKARLKHQTLMQEYQDLYKEAEGMRDKLEIMKQRKLTLLAEVRFLRRRHKYLLKNKSLTPPQERELVKPQNLETKRKSNTKGRIYNKKEATPRNLPSIFNLNQKGRVYMGKEAALLNTQPIFDLNHKETLHSGKEAALDNPTVILDLNHRGRMYRGREAALREPSPNFDFTRVERTLGGKESAFQSRAPIFDLNQVSREDEEFEDNCESLRFEEPKKGSIRGGSDEPANDLKLSVCRNIGDGSSRGGKRKISWQDPVALRV